MSVLSQQGCVTDGAGAGGTALAASAARDRANASPGAPRSAWGHLVLPGRIRRCPDTPRAGNRLHRPGGAAGPGAPPWRGVWGVVPCYGGEHAMVPGLSRAGYAAVSGGAGLGPGAGASL